MKSPEFLPQYEKGVHNVKLENSTWSSYIKKYKGKVLTIWQKYTNNKILSQQIDISNDTKIPSIQNNYDRYLKCREKLFKDNSLFKLYLLNEGEIKNISQEELVELIEKGLEDKHILVKSKFTKIIQYIQDGKLREQLLIKLQNIIDYELDNNGLNIEEVFVKMIEYIQDKESKKRLYIKLKSLIEKGLEDKNINVLLKCHHLIKYIPDYKLEEELDIKLKEMIEKDIDSGHIYSGLCSAEYVQYIQDKESKKRLYIKLKSLIEKGLEDKNINVKYKSASIIIYIEDDNLKEDLYIKLKSVIEKGMQDKNINVAWNSYQMIGHIQNDIHKKELIEKAMDSIYKNIRQESINFIQYVHDNNFREELIKKTINKGLIKKYKLPISRKEHSLYNYRGGSRIINGNTSSTIDKLVDNNHNEMLGKVYKRTTSLMAFLSQMKAFEAHDTWKRLGFNHIPIETVYRFRKDKNNRKISFFAKVYDDVLTNLISTDLYILHFNSIKEQKDKILEGLKELGISHNDFEYKNICISWQRSAGGKIDLTKPPLLYLIDWDLARFD